MSITVDDMRHKLLTVEQARTRLGATEPVHSYHFQTGNAVRFSVDAGWQHGLKAKADDDPVSAWVHLGRGSSAVSLQLTKDAVLDAAARCGLPRTYLAQIPARLAEDQLNYWFHEDGMALRGKGRTAERDLQVVVVAGKAIAWTKAAHTPYSNLRLLDEALAGIAERCPGDEVLVDYKFAHSPKHTRLRLIIPGRVRRITGTGVSDDAWSVGVQLSASLLGETGIGLEGYLFRWFCTNGAIDTTANVDGGYLKRNRPVAETDEGYQWVRTSTVSTLDRLDASLDAVQELVNVPVEGDLKHVLRDVFLRRQIPSGARSKIIETLAGYPDTHQLTMYDLMNAITQAANDPAMQLNDADRLMAVGGELPHTGRHRCDACHRIMPSEQGDRTVTKQHKAYYH